MRFPRPRRGNAIYPVCTTFDPPIAQFGGAKYTHWANPCRKHEAPAQGAGASSIYPLGRGTFLGAAALHRLQPEGDVGGSAEGDTERRRGEDDGERRAAAAA